MRAVVTSAISVLFLATQVHATTTCTRQTMAGNWMLEFGPVYTQIPLAGGGPLQEVTVNALCDLDLMPDRTFSGGCYLPEDEVVFSMSGTLSVGRNCVMRGVFILDGNEDAPFTLEGRVTADAGTRPALMLGVGYVEEPESPLGYSARGFSAHRRPLATPFNPRNMPRTPLGEAAAEGRTHSFGFSHRQND